MVYEENQIKYLQRTNKQEERIRVCSLNLKCSCVLEIIALTMERVKVQVYKSRIILVKVDSEMSLLGENANLLH